jgi:CheY-like chemotaxis protein
LTTHPQWIGIGALYVITLYPQLFIMGRNPRVLHLEDHRILREAFGPLYEDNGIDVTLVATPEAALEELRKSGNEYDVVVVDLSMADRHGKKDALQPPDVLAEVIRDHPLTQGIIYASTEKLNVPGVIFLDKMKGETALIDTIKEVYEHRAQKTIANGSSAQPAQGMKDLSRLWRPILHRTSGGDWETLMFARDCADEATLNKLNLGWKPLTSAVAVKKLEDSAHLHDDFKRFDPSDPSILNLMDLKTLRNAKAMKNRTKNR